MMQSSLKQRILGFIVLVSLAIIVLPIILDGDNGRTPSKKAIPVKPNLDSPDFSIKKPLPPESSVAKTKAQISYSDSGNESANIKLDVKEDSTVKEQAKEKDKEPSSNTANDNANNFATSSEQDAKKGEAVGTKNGLTTWVIQVASFSNKDNANKLVSKLKDKSFKAFKKTKINNGKSLYIVYVGQYKSKDAAQKDIANVEKESGLKVLIHPFSEMLD